jgi:hypothetical protein
VEPDLQDELETLRSRFEKIEKERNDLKIANERLESRVGGSDVLSAYLGRFHLFIYPKINKSRRGNKKA